MATIQDLVVVESQATLHAIRWLRFLADTLDATGLYFDNRPILGSATMMNAFVCTNDLNSGQRHEDSSAHEMSMIDETSADLYEQPRDLIGREKKRWRNVIQPTGLRLGVRGAPGGGKTFLTRNAAVALARKSIRQLEKREIDLHNVPVPFWITAEALAFAKGPDVAKMVVDASVRALKHMSGHMPAPPLDWLEQAAASERALIVVDAIDQLVFSAVEEFKQRCPRLRDLPGRLITTCRTIHWAERMRWLGWPDIVEVDLAPFANTEQREFSRTFPPGVGAPGLDQLLAANYQLRGACNSPLLLTFVCLMLAEGKNLAAASRTTVYIEVLRRLLSGSWRNVTPPWRGDKKSEEKVIEFLEVTAWRILNEAPQANRFIRAQWERAGTEPVQGLLFELEKCGVLIDAGEDDLGNRAWSFLHRTLLEFFAGRALSRQPKRIWLAEAKKHFWYEPEWVEVLSFLAAHLEDATPLMEALEKKGHDPFFTSLYLKVRLATAAKHIHETKLKAIETEVQWLFIETTYGEMRAWWTIFQQIALQARSGPLADTLAKALCFQAWRAAFHSGTGTEIQLVADRLVMALGLLGGAFAFDFLAKIFDASPLPGANVLMVEKQFGLFRARRVDEHIQDIGGQTGYLEETMGEAFAFQLAKCISEAPQVRQNAVRALADLGDNRALGVLVLCLKDRDQEVRGAAALALGKSGDAGMLDTLVGLLHDKEPRVRSFAARALGDLGDTRAADALAEMLRDKHPLVRLGTAYALELFGDPRSLEAFEALLRDESPHIRQAAVGIVGKIGGGQRSFELVAKMLLDQDQTVRAAAAKGLADLGDPQGLGVLVRCLQDKDTRIQFTAAARLADIGDARGLAVLANLLEHKNIQARLSAARELAKVGDVRGFSTLTALLRHADPDVSFTAAFNLGNLRDDRGFDVLTAALEGGAPEVRESAVKILRKLFAARNRRKGFES